MSNDLIAGTSVVWLPVTDMDRALSFYRDVLGLAEQRNEGEWAELTTGRLTIGLNASAGESPHGDGGAVLAFQCADGIEAAVQQLRDRGTQIAGEISEHPWGRIATFRDPDGNDLQLYEPPAG